MLKKPKTRFLMMSLSLLSVLILVLSACGATGTPSPTPSTGNAVKGGTWIDDLFEEPDSFISNGVSETFADLVDQTIWAPLFVGDTNGHIQLGLVREMPTVQNGDVSADAKTWTFKLRPGLKWSDGQPLDARDVDYTWRLWDNKLPGQNPKAQFTPASTTGYNLIQSADISSDNLTITFHLSRAYAPFLSLWTDGLAAPMPAHVLSKISPDKILSSSENLKPSVASGPFMMTESVPGDHFTVVRNPMYYRASEGLPYLDKIVFQIRANQDTILKDLQAGSIDSAWFLDVSKTIAYQRLTDYKLVSNPNASNFEAIYFNFQDPILGKDLGVRKAIAMTINHQNLIDGARRGQAAPLCTDHGKAYVPGYQQDVQCTPYDPAGAAKLLDSEGWAMGNDGYRHKGGQTLDFQYSTTANNVWRTDDQVIIQSELKGIGIKIDIQNYPAGTFFGPILQDGKFQIAEFENSWTYDADDESLMGCDQFPPTGSNFGRYCNQQLQQLFVQEESTFDNNARQQAFNQIHQIYLTDFPFITLYSPTDIAMVKNGANGYMPGPEGASETVNVWNWWCSGGKCPA